MTTRHKYHAGRLCLIASVTCVAVLLSSCIPVADLGAYWTNGKTDPRIAGSWVEPDLDHPIDDSYMDFGLDEAAQAYRFRNLDATKRLGEERHVFLVRTANLGGFDFLLLTDAEAVSNTENLNTPIEGGLIRYDIDGDKLTIFTLDDSTSFLRDAIRSGVFEGAGDDSSTLARLDERTVAALAVACERDELWREAVYQRVDNLAAARAVSLTYPAGPDTDANRTVPIELTDLTWFADDRTDVLKHALQASPRWRVAPEGNDGEAVAYLREKQPDGWTVTLGGYHYRRAEAGEGSIQTRIVYRFAPDGGGAYRSLVKRHHLTAAAPKDGDVALNLVSSDQGIASYLAVGKPGVWLEIFEETRREPRAITRKALMVAAEELAAIREAEIGMRTNGFSADTAPDAGLAQTAPSIMVTADSSGTYDVHAWVRPKQHGTAYLKVIRLDTGEAIQAEWIKKDTSEFLSASRGTKTSSLFNCNITIGGLPSESPTDVRFEVWLAPADGVERDEKLTETTASIVGWRR